MLRIRWTDPAEDAGALHGWQQPSLILTTLFLNFFFWFEPADQFWFNGSRTVVLDSLAALCALVLLFFLAPALAAHASRQSLFQVAEASFGVIPAFAFRLACAVFCLVWIAGVAGMWTFQASWLLFNRELSAVEFRLLAGPLILLLFGTGLQSLGASAKLATFTNKLGIALLIAGAIRVRENLGLPWAAPGSLNSIESEVLRRLAEPLILIGPLAFLAADFGCRARTRKDVALVGIFGLAVPMVLTVVVVGFIRAAANGPGLGHGNSRNIAVALWGGDADRYWRPWIAIAMITLFGIARFAVRKGAAAVSPMVKGRKARLALLAVAFFSCVMLSMDGIYDITRMSAPLAASAVAILTVDYFFRGWRKQKHGRWDWVAVLSFLAGWAVNSSLSFWFGAEYQEQRTQQILIAYVVSFVLCSTGRAIEGKVKATGP